MMPPQPGIMPFIVCKRIGGMRFNKCAYTLASKSFVKILYINIVNFNIIQYL